MTNEPYTNFLTGETKLLDDPFPEGMLDDIAAYLRDDYARPRGQDVYQGVFDSPLFFPLQRKRELAKMMRVARTIEPKIIYEIGSDKGGGLYHWIKCLPTVTAAVACEIRGTPYKKLFEENFQKRDKPVVQFKWVEGSSHNAKNVRSVVSWLDGGTIDCLFIDGDKANFLADFYAYLPWMSRPGIVFMHDIQDEPTGGAYRQASANFRHEEIVDASELAELGNPRTAYEHWLKHWNGRSCGVGVIYID